MDLGILGSNQRQQNLRRNWVIYIISYHENNQRSMPSQEADPPGELAGRIFRLVNLTVQQKQTCEGLEIACPGRFGPFV